MLDFVAKRYGMLPSQVMKLGDSVDVRVATLGVGYEAHQRDKSNRPVDNKGYTTEQLQQMMTTVRSAHNVRENNAKQDNS